MGAISPQYFALGVGSSGALVDVSAFVTGVSDGVSRRYGQLDSFRDATPGTFTVVLDNYDGRFTPENTTANAAAGYSTTVTEGMAACVQIGSRLTAGQVIGIRPLLGSDWGRIQITCDDALGKLSRVGLTGPLWYAQPLNTGYAYWPFNEPAYSNSGADVLGNAGPFVDDPNDQSYPTFAVTNPAATAGMPESWVQLTSAPPVTPRQFGLTSTYPTFDYPSGSVGTFGFWADVSGVVDDSPLEFGVGIVGVVPVKMRIRPSLLTIAVGTVAVTTSVTINNSSQPHYYAMVLSWTATTFTADVYRDSVLVASATKTGLSLSGITFTAGSPQFAAYADGASTNTFLIASLSHTPEIVYGNYNEPTTLENRIQAITSNADVSFTTADLWGATAGEYPASGGSALEAINDVVRTEQGYLYPVTTGTLTSNTESLVIRERTRPTTVTASFDAITELANAPEFIRDLTNTVSLTSVSGPDLSVTVADPTLIPRVGNKNDSDYTVLAEAGDLSLWGQDRLQRGGLVSLRLASLVIDAMTTPTDRSADLLALVPGDRIRVTNLPDDVLGFTEWDGWVVGGEETHNPTMNRFTFSLAPVLPPVPVFNDARYTAGTSLTLSSTINNSVTSISIATTDATFTTDSTDLPVNILIDSEEMTVTAVSSATPQVFTVTRGVNGTTAVSHSSGAQVELASVEPADDAVFTTNRFVDPYYLGSVVPVNESNMGSVGVVTSGGLNWASGTAGSSGTAAIRVCGNSDRPLASAGETWYGVVTARNPNAGSRTLWAALRYYDTAGATLGTTLATFTTSQLTVAAGADQTFTVSGLAPSGAASVVLFGVRQSGGGAATSDLLYLRGVYLGTDAVTAAYSGSSPNTATLFHSWQSAANASWSYQATDGQVQPATFGF